MHVMPDLAFPFKSEAGYGQVFEAISQMRRDSIDVAIVFFHWGYEYEYYPDSKIRNLAKQLSKAGADLVIGSHPHVIQPVEYLSSDPASNHQTFNQQTSNFVEFSEQNTLVFYSLGNFTTTMYTTACKIGMIGEIAITKSDQKKPQIHSLEPGFVYNYNKGFAGRKRRLLLISPTEETVPEEIPKRKWKRIQKEMNKLGWSPGNNSFD
jgi:poly-gamma-glutamate capsule biosynthesis protein CapA/YwtB (metallophosphatase superfamily)